MKCEISSKIVADLIITRTKSLVNIVEVSIFFIYLCLIFEKRENTTHEKQYIILKQITFNIDNINIEKVLNNLSKEQNKPIETVVVDLLKQVVEDGFCRAQSVLVTSLLPKQALISIPIKRLSRLLPITQSG